MMGGEQDLCDNELHIAVRLGDVEATLKALNKGFDPNLIGLYEWNALHEAAYNGDEEILEILIKYGADINKQDLLNGNTALHYAAIESHPKSLDILLTKGADYEIINQNNQSAVDLVSSSSCKQTLLNHGCVSSKEKAVKSILKTSKAAKGSLNVYSKPLRTSSPVQVQRSGGDDGRNLNFEETPSPSDDDVKSFPSLTNVLLRQGWELPPSEKLLQLPASPARSIGSSYGSMTSLGSSGCSIADDCAGQFVMSFEYHSRKETFKIRVWEIRLSTLLPPSKMPKETSVCFYFRSVLILPGEFRSNSDRKRKSEIFRLSCGEQEYTDRHSLTASKWGEKEARLEFKSSISLEYANICKDMVDSSTLKICLCIQRKQRTLLPNKFKQSTSSDPVIASIEIEMKSAVKNLMKESYDTERHDVIGVTRQAFPLDGVVSETSSYENHSFNSDPSVRVASLSSSANHITRSSSMDQLSSQQLRSDKKKKEQSYRVTNAISQSKLESAVDLTSEEGRDSGIDKSGTYSVSSLESVLSHASITNPEVSIQLPLKKSHRLTSVMIDRKEKSSSADSDVTIAMPRYTSKDFYKGLGQKRPGERSKGRMGHRAKTKFKSVVRPNVTMVTAFDDEERALGSPAEEDFAIDPGRGHAPASPSSLVEVNESPSRSRPERPRPFLYSPQASRKKIFSSNSLQRSPASANNHLIVNVDHSDVKGDLEAGVKVSSKDCRRRIEFSAKDPLQNLSPHRLSGEHLKVTSPVKDLRKLILDDASSEETELAADNPCYVKD